MMKNYLRPIILTVMCCFGLSQLQAQDKYSDYKVLNQKIDALSNQYPSLCSFKSIVFTAGGKDIRVITIGSGDKDNKPGIAIVGGIEGNYLLGRELVAGFATSILKESASPEIKELLNKVTFYIIPDVSPDASEQYFSDIKYERAINTRPTDDDKDFVFDEDPYEDLNEDGSITLIRVKDPSGKYIESKDDKRIMVTADLSKGEKGSYMVYSEGIDNDKDGKFNEDGLGGVSFNRNFTFNYEEFGINAGLYPVSEPETKAIADFLYDRFNIYAVFSFGPQDNLGQPLKASERPSASPAETTGMRRGMAQGNRIITSILKSDEVINKLVSDKYHEITGIKGSPATKSTPGNFMDWAYYHYGRYSFSTPGWWITPEKGKSIEATLLSLSDKKGADKVFVPWTEIKHPDFPDKLTEVGGIIPFVTINPPADTISYLIEKNYRFITAIAAMHPELEFLDIKTENRGENIFSITLKIHNKGDFATSTEIGVRNTFTRLMRLSVEPAKNQNLISGEMVQRINRLEGNQAEEFTWLIQGKGVIKVTAGAVNTGTATTSIELK